LFSLTQVHFLKYSTHSNSGGGGGGGGGSGGGGGVFNALVL
jgi:hypothetical protein